MNYDKLFCAHLRGDQLRSLQMQFKKHDKLAPCTELSISDGPFLFYAAAHFAFH
jgi:hypothetical protein